MSGRAGAHVALIVIAMVALPASAAAQMQLRDGTTVYGSVCTQLHAVYREADEARRQNAEDAADLETLIRNARSLRRPVVDASPAALQDMMATPRERLADFRRRRPSGSATPDDFLRWDIRRGVEEAKLDFMLKAFELRIDGKAADPAAAAFERAMQALDAKVYQFQQTGRTEAARVRELEGKMRDNRCDIPNRPDPALRGADADTPRDDQMPEGLSGTWTSTFGPLKFTQTGPRLDGVLGPNQWRFQGALTGAEFNGMWANPTGSASSQCPRPQMGSTFWGRIRFTIKKNADGEYDFYEGSFSFCDTEPGSGAGTRFSGRRVRQPR